MFSIRKVISRRVRLVILAEYCERRDATFHFDYRLQICHHFCKLLWCKTSLYSFYFVFGKNDSLELITFFGKPRIHRRGAPVGRLISSRLMKRLGASSNSVADSSFCLFAVFNREIRLFAPLKRCQKLGNEMKLTNLENPLHF